MIIKYLSIYLFIYLFIYSFKVLAVIVTSPHAQTKWGAKFKGMTSYQEYNRRVAN